MAQLPLFGEREPAEPDSPRPERKPPPASAPPSATLFELFAAELPSPPPPAELELGQALRAALELVTDPRQWTQGASARDATGQPVPPMWREAVRFSAYGALARFSSDSRAALDRLSELTPPHRGRSQAFARWHDQPTTTHAAVLELLSRAAEESSHAR